MDIIAALLALSLLQTNPVAKATDFDPPFVCDNCAEWNEPQAPFKLHGRSYYVGTRGLSAVLIQTSEGLILLDGGLPQSAPLIEQNIRTLGFKVEDVRLIVNSHAHYDHAGGIARLQRVSGAVVAASPSGAEAMRNGRAVKDDPQFNVDGSDGLFPKVAKVREVQDKEQLKVGDTTITAHHTPGHTPGSTTWTWRSCDGPACLNMVYADSLTAISTGDFRYLGDARRPDVSEAFRRSIAVVKDLPCDLMLSTHPSASGLFERLDRRLTSPSPDPLLDAGACRAYADRAAKNLDARLKTERP